MSYSKMLEVGKHRSVIRETFEEGKIMKKIFGEENVYDFSLGNPNISSPPIVNDTLIRLLQKYPNNIHLYTSSAGDNEARIAIADYLTRTYGYKENYERVYMTCGAAAALTITLNALINDGDEVILISPYFAEYRIFVEKAGAVVIEVDTSEDMQLNVDNIEKAITSKTKAIIINSPNNPSGVVYSCDDLKKLGCLLDKIQNEKNQIVYVISDEPYRELVYDGLTCPYIPSLIKNTISCYSFSKSLSMPGERIGYICVHANCENGDEVFYAIQGSGRALGYVCAPSLFQKMIPYVIGKTSDISKYDENRKIIYNALKDIGFSLVYPQGAFYLFMKTPVPNAREFCETAKKYNILVVRGDEFGKKGYVRISYCVSKETILNSLNSWKRLGEEYFK